MNMRDADIRALIQWVADTTGKNIVVHKDVQAEVTVLSSESLTSDEAYQVFLSVLQVHGFAAIETPEALKIVPRNIANTGAPTYSGRSTTSDIVVNVVKVENVSAAQLANTLRPLLDKQAIVSAYAATNTLIIADHKSNMNTVAHLITQLDKTGDTQIELIKLKYANASDILSTLTALMPSTGAGGTPLDITMSVDDRSNSIMLAGDPAKRKQLKQLIAKLDTSLKGEGNTQVIYLHYVDAKEISPILQKLAKGIQTSKKDESNEVIIEASESANALVINAPPAILNTLKKVIAKLDIRRAQVLVEAVVVEVSGEVSDDLGVTWITGRDKNAISAVNTLGSLDLANPSLDTNATGIGAFSPARGFTFGYFENGNLQAAIRALNATQNTNILSTPTIVAIDNEEASLLVGQNVPFKTGQSTSSSSTTNNPFTTIERHDIGISLKVTPRINQGDSITLEIHQKTESVAPSIAAASDIITNKREFITTALIKDNQILVIGGLISDEETQVTDKVPVLGSLPLIGKLFSSEGTTHSKKNLMVFIHPVILKDDEHIKNITQTRYNFMKNLQQQAKTDNVATSKNATLMKDFETLSPAKLLK
ncbi:MAG: type II secretion system secretin GspD [Spongiibacteraceae bacterium]|nr:type II secretion system secretin GspD [Spongiibacteraceae bacterium]